MRNPLFVLALSVLATACGRHPTTSAPPSAEIISAGTLTPGRAARLHGRHLAGETRVVVDGAPADLRAVTDSTAEFDVPVLRPCDTDGRQVTLALAPSGATVIAPLHLTTTVTLAPGETQLVTATDNCLQLPAADADYVVSALNGADKLTEIPDHLAEVTVYTATDPAPLDVGPAVRYRGASTLAWRSRSRAAVAAAALPWPAPYAAAPELFDARYATAAPGDTVIFVDWQHAASCRQPRDAAPRYSAAVAAVVGLTVIAVDLRLPNANDFLTPAGRTYLTRAASIADPLIVATMRRVFDAGYQPLPAAGGRHFHIVTALTGVADATDGNTSKPQSQCPLASETVTTLLAPPVLSNPIGPRIVATQLVHEYAHNADEITARRHANPGGSIGWIQEAFAVNAEETAARIALGESSGAQLSRLTDAMPFRAGTTNSDWALYPARSAWTATGAYKQGAALLSFARERIGEAVLDGAEPSLYLTLLQRNAWDIRAVAEVLGRRADELLDSWAIADACDDLAAPKLTALRLASWDDTDRIRGNEGPRGGSPSESRPSRSAQRAGAHSDTELTAAPGSYAALYIFADRALGATLRIRPGNVPTTRVRLTRTR